MILNVPVKCYLSYLRLLYSLCTGTLKTPKVKKKFGIAEYNRLTFFRDYLKSEIDNFELRGSQK